MVRVKHRYFLVNILYPEEGTFTSTGILPDLVRVHQPTPDGVTASVLLGEIRERVNELFGDYGSGVAATDMSIKYFSNATSTFILRCPRQCFRLVWASLAMLTTLQPPVTMDGSQRDSLQCVLRVMHVSGTIRKAEEVAIKQARQNVLRATGSGEGPDAIQRLLMPVAISTEVDRSESDGSESDDVAMYD